ncbi:hypothetical protein JG687_00005583 [Phytophthora cactorum]|uniref:Uncharacterized protein n=1 Tax=Phytophthora cactorum TaxID=29920 RepID=A0A8T1UPZ5_9STRA|nr:hypothetical protein JG687_00005583 [Phytophthora cactorum]
MQRGPSSAVANQEPSSTRRQAMVSAHPIGIHMDEYTPAIDGSSAPGANTTPNQDTRITVAALYRQLYQYDCSTHKPGFARGSRTGTVAETDRAQAEKTS